MFIQTSYEESVNDKHRLGELKAITTGGKAETDQLVEVPAFSFTDLELSCEDKPAIISSCL